MRLDKIVTRLAPVVGACLGVLVLAAGTCHAEPASVARADAARGIESLIDEYADLEAFSGAMLVADEDGIIVQKAYGLANRDREITNALDTRFLIGSLSKQFTAALVLRLVDEGSLGLDDRLVDVLPWYREDTGRLVTIRDLLNHSSGIDRSGVPRMIEEHGRTAMPLAEEVATYCSGDLESEPGTRFAYNNAGYLILGAVVEEMYGAPYRDVLERVITGPVGLPDTGMDDSGAILPRRAEGYVRAAHGLRRPEFVVDMPVGPRGEPVTVIRHPGQGDGFHSIVWRIPEGRVAIVLINNLGRTDLDGMATASIHSNTGRVTNAARDGRADSVQNEYCALNIQTRPWSPNSVPSRPAKRSAWAATSRLGVADQLSEGST